MSHLFTFSSLAVIGTCLFSLSVTGKSHAMHFARLLHQQQLNRQLNICTPQVQPPQSPVPQVQLPSPVARFDMNLAYYRKLHCPSEHDNRKLQKVGEETMRKVRKMIATGYYQGHVKAPSVDYQKVYIYDTDEDSRSVGRVIRGAVKRFSLGHPKHRKSARYSFMRMGMVDAGLHYYYKTDDEIAIMNFANAFRTGGDFIGGASAQEETLCRCSSLYASLISEKAKQDYYQYNKDNKNDRISERVMVSPDVAFLRYDDDYEWFEKPIVMSVITAAAVDKRSKRMRGISEKKVDRYMRHLVRNTIKAAADNGIDTLVLGAFGCGVFGNDPKVVSRYFRCVLVDEGYDRYFKNIVFAIPDSRHGVSRNMREFVSAFRRYNVRIRRDETRGH